MTKIKAWWEAGEWKGDTAGLMLPKITEPPTDDGGMPEIPPGHPVSPLDLLWGAAEIAAFIGRDERQTFTMLKSGVLPAKKVGGRWVASPAKLAKLFLEE